MKEAPSIADQVDIRHDLRPGDLGRLVSLHGVLYAREYGYDHTFEAYVAAGTAEFALAFHPLKDRLWMVEVDRQTIGSIAVVKRSEWEAQLRWFLIHPDWRGKGLGRVLLERALQFCRDCGYRNIFLWTVSYLAAATYLYKTAGFQKTEEKMSQIWGHLITEERYDLQMTSPGENRI